MSKPITALHYLGVVSSGGVLLLLVASQIRSRPRVVHIFDCHDCALKTLIKELVNFQTRELVIHITEVTITVVEILLQVLDDDFLLLIACLP